MVLLSLFVKYHRTDDLIWFQRLNRIYRESSKYSTDCSLTIIPYMGVSTRIASPSSLCMSSCVRCRQSFSHWCNRSTSFLATSTRLAHGCPSSASSCFFHTRWTRLEEATRWPRRIQMLISKFPKSYHGFAHWNTILTKTMGNMTRVD